MNATLLDSAAGGMAGLAGAAVLVLALATLLARRPAIAVALVAAQSACLAVALLAVAWLQSAWPLLAVAAFTIAAKAIALPLGLRLIIPVLTDTPRHGVIGPAAAMVALAGLAVAMTAPEAGIGLAMALGVMLVGGLAVLARDNGIAGPVIGVLVLENGLVLAMASVPGLTGVALLAIATAMLPAAALLVLVRRLLPGPDGA